LTVLYVRRPRPASSRPAGRETERGSLLEYTRYNDAEYYGRSGVRVLAAIRTDSSHVLEQSLRVTIITPALRRLPPLLPRRRTRPGATVTNKEPCASAARIRTTESTESTYFMHPPHIRIGGSHFRGDRFQIDSASHVFSVLGIIARTRRERLGAIKLRKRAGRRRSDDAPPRMEKREFHVGGCYASDGAMRAAQ
jgi:hypothetical protein